MRAKLDRLRAQRTEQLVRNQARLRCVGGWEQHRELIAAEPGEHVGLTQPRGEHFGGLDDRLVAGVMPERVVDELEVVQVEHDHCAPAAIARRAHPMGVELTLEAAAVQQPRQRVVVGQVHQPLLRASGGR